MTPNITSSIVRPSTNVESKVEYVNPNAVVRSTALASGTPLIERNLFIAPEGVEYIGDLKITSNSIAEASASPAELDAVTRTLPQSITNITFPRTLLQPSEEAVLSGRIDSQSQAPADAVNTYARVSTITATPEFLLNDLA